MKLACHFQNSSPFTVGELRSLICRGKDIPVLSSPLKIQFQNESNKYALHILSVQSASQKEILLQVTGYKPGQYENTVFWITDGVQSFTMDLPLSWEISSVLQPSQQGVQPYPPYGPWKIAFPLWYGGAWLTLFLIVLGFVVMRVKKIRRQKEIRKQISDRLGDQTPVQYFIRQLSRFFIHKNQNKKKFLTQLNQCLREFLENQLEIPLKDPIRKVVKNKKIYKDKKIKQILSELDTALNTEDSYSEKDGEQLLNMVRNWVFQFGKEDGMKK